LTVRAIECPQKCNCNQQAANSQRLSSMARIE
jgi:hypothetical protein